jgi:hypothetical protein
MKSRKTFLILAMTVALTLPTLAFAGSGGPYSQIGGDTGDTGSGNCLSSYNGCLITCDRTTESNTRIGCKTDCWFSYYFCISRSAMN